MLHLYLRTLPSRIVDGLPIAFRAKKDTDTHREKVPRADAAARNVKFTFSNHHGIETIGFLGPRVLTYSLAISVVLSEVELATIDQKNLYSRVLYEPPWHPLWGVAPDELTPAFLVHNLVELHRRGVSATIGFYPDEHEQLMGNSRMKRALDELAEMLALRRPETETYEI